MPSSYAFKLEIDENAASQLKQEITKALESAEIEISESEVWQFEGPPPGAFGFGEGILKFLESAWRELVKVPGAVLAVAEGIREYLKKRPDTVIELTRSDGSTATIKANMDGEDIVKILNKFYEKEKN